MQPSWIEDDKIEVILMESSRWEQETSMNEQLKMKALWAHAYVHRMCACYYQIGFGLDHFYSYWKFQTKKKSFAFRFFLQFYFIFFHRCRTMLEMVFFPHSVVKGPVTEQTIFKSVNKIENTHNVAGFNFKVWEIQESNWMAIFSYWFCFWAFLFPIKLNSECLVWHSIHARYIATDFEPHNFIIVYCLVGVSLSLCMLLWLK